jgi:hypothetical protein
MLTQKNIYNEQRNVIIYLVNLLVVVVDYNGNEGIALRTRWNKGGRTWT